MKPEEELSTYIETLASRMKVTEESCRDQVGLQEMHVLCFIGRCGTPKMTEIAAHLRLSLSNLTAIVDKLEAKQFALRMRSDDDRRVVRVSLTAEGHNTTEMIWAQKRELARLMLAALKKSDQDKLLEIMRKIVAHMSRIGD